MGGKAGSPRQRRTAAHAIGLTLGTKAAGGAEMTNSYFSFKGLEAGRMNPTPSALRLVSAFPSGAPALALSEGHVAAPSPDKALASALPDISGSF